MKKFFGMDVPMYPIGKVGSEARSRSGIRRLQPSSVKMKETDLRQSAYSSLEIFLRQCYTEQRESEEHCLAASTKINFS